MRQEYLIGPLTLFVPMYGRITLSGEYLAFDCHGSSAILRSNSS